MDPAFRWMSRYTNYCVSVVQTDDGAEVLRAFGGDPDQSVEGGVRQAADLYLKSAEHWPVVRIVRVGGWCVAIETVSVEALRVPVLSELSMVGRVAVVGVDHLPQRRMAYADGGTVWGPFAPPKRTSADWHQLEQIAEHAGVSLAGWVDGEHAASSIEFLGRVAGTPIDDDVMAAPGVVGVVLPLLPTPFDVQGVVRSDVEALLVAMAESATDEQLRPAVARQVRAMVIDAGVESEEITNVITGYGNGEVVELNDSSPVGQALRRLLAEHWQMTAPSPRTGRRRGPDTPQVDVESVRQRVSAGSVAVALLRGGPRSAVAEMLHRRRGVNWPSDLVSELERVGVDPSVTDDASARLSDFEARRRRMIPIAPGLLRSRDASADRPQRYRNQHPG